MKLPIRYLAVLMMVFAVGCAPVPSLEELEAKAEITGDWTDVERYERMLARRDVRSGLSCPAGKIRYCEEIIGGERCMCAPGEQMRVLLMSR